MATDLFSMHWRGRESERAEVEGMPRMERVFLGWVDACQGWVGELRVYGGAQ